jgi:uncharacterized OsmC-like protein
MTPQAVKKPANDSFNGFDTRAMTQTIGAITQNRTLARFEFRAANQWLGGGMNRSTIQGFFGAGAEDKSRAEPFKYINGEPPVLLGHNEGANPGEFLLHALAGCVTTTTILHAAARGIRIESMSSELIGDIDLQGLLALDKSVPASFRKITMKVDIEADCSDAELDELLNFVHAHSPVCDTVCRPVPVVLERVKRI